MSKSNREALVGVCVLSGIFLFGYGCRFISRKIRNARLKKVTLKIGKAKKLSLSPYEKMESFNPEDRQTYLNEYWCQYDNMTFGLMDINASRYSKASPHDDSSGRSTYTSRTLFLTTLPDEFAHFGMEAPERKYKLRRPGNDDDLFSLNCSDEVYKIVRQNIELCKTFEKIHNLTMPNYYPYKFGFEVCGPYLIVFSDVDKVPVKRIQTFVKMGFEIRKLLLDNAVFLKAK